MRLVPASPIRYERSVAFVTRQRGCSLEDVRVPVYERSRGAERIVALRKEIGLGLRDAASRMGIRAAELSGLERGSLVPEHRATGWSEIEAALRGSSE